MTESFDLNGLSALVAGILIWNVALSIAVVRLSVKHQSAVRLSKSLMLSIEDLYSGQTRTFDRMSAMLSIMKVGP